LELLETFLVVAETGSVSKAAQALYRSQPAISERLQRLTEMAGEPLYHSVGRGIRLTPAGEAYLTPARRLRVLKDELEDMFQRRRHLQEGILKIAATNTVANYFCLNIWSTFVRIIREWNWYCAGVSPTGPGILCWIGIFFS